MCHRICFGSCMDICLPMVLISITIIYMQPRMNRFSFKYYSKICFLIWFDFFLYSRWPFDWKTPLNYIAVVVFQSIAAYIIILILLCTILIPVAHCVFIMAFCSDLRNDVRVLNEIMKIGSGKNQSIQTNDIIEIKRKLCKNIEFQYSVRQLSEN